MQSRLKMFNRVIKPCNPYQDFWEYLEWLGRHRHFPEPMHIWHITGLGKQTLSQDNIKFRFNKKFDTWHFPAANDDDEILRCRFK
jgi:hypothetical protein